jgi:sialic acid synthase SpsE
VDGFFSLDKAEFTQMVEEVRKAEKALGRVDYSLGEEGKKNLWGRRSLYVSGSVKKGDVLSRENIKSVRPAFGLHPRHLKEVLGKRFKRDLEMGDRLSMDDIE